MAGEFEQFEQFGFDDLTASATVASAQVNSLTSVSDRLQYLIDNTPAIIYTSVPTGDFKMTFVSANAFHVLGYRPEDMISDPNFWYEHIHPEDREAIFSSIARLFSEGKRTYEYRFLSSAGQYVWMHDMLRLILDEAGKPVEVIGSLTDITERKLMEVALQKKGEEQQLLITKLNDAHEQLLQSEKMASVGQLAAGVAHEINNPIGFVNSNMGALKNYVKTLFEVLDQIDHLVKKFPPDHEITKRFESIREKADLVFLRNDIDELVNESMDGLKRVKDIVQSLKDFSHVGEVNVIEADIHQGLDSTLNIVMNEIKYKAVVIKEYGQLPLVKCLISQLNQVFMNMLVNASHAMKEMGTITIRTACKDDNVIIQFLDNGSGIPPEALSRIFEPFFTTKPVGSGTGLGLSLAYGIVKKHGGRIEVESEVGVGTCFSIYLPINPILQNQ
ncbi:MAG: ATP-binding protein [Pseudomonadota bacterium]